MSPGAVGGVKVALTVKQSKTGTMLRATALLLGLAASASAISPLPLSGSLGGNVKSTAGVVQMGATVILYNRYDRAIRQVLTNEDGSFRFDSLLPDVYSLRVSLSSFIPAFKRNIAIRPGFHSVLTINMASMLSSIEFVSSSPIKGSLMSDDWKWVLRSSQSTRPVLRYADLGPSIKVAKSRTNVFSETRGIVKVSAGDATSFAGTTAQPDLGTAFAIATSLFGSNQFEISGNFGYSAHTGMPTAGFRTQFTRSTGGMRTPELTVSMHQVYLPTRGGFGPQLGQDAPSLRTMAISTYDELGVTDRIRIEYGMSAESMSLLNRLNVLSPFARLTFDMGHAGSVQLGYSNGATATELVEHSRDGREFRESAALDRDLSALAALPRVSLRNDHLAAQRTENIELGYRKVAGSREYSAGVFHERVRDGAVTLAGSGELFDGDVLPDLGSQSAVFNTGRFNRWGYVASVTQNVGDRVEISVAYGRGGALTTSGRTLTTDDADALRKLIHLQERNWATARVAGTVPGSGTRISASYGWADYRSLMPSHLYLTQRLTPEPGLNIIVRQPLPSVAGVPGRFEASAELRNLLEQGYLSVTSTDGRTMLLTNAPRALRGGLSFIF